MTVTTSNIGKRKDGEEEDVVVLQASPVQAPAHLELPRYKEPSAAEHGHVNTSRLYDEAESIDEEPEISFISPATGFEAVFEDGSTRRVVLWAVQDDGSMFGVALPEDGKPPLSVASVEDEDGFVRYKAKAEEA